MPRHAKYNAIKLRESTVIHTTQKQDRQRSKKSIVICLFLKLSSLTILSAALHVVCIL